MSKIVMIWQINSNLFNLSINIKFNKILHYKKMMNFNYNINDFY